MLTRMRSKVAGENLCKECKTKTVKENESLECDICQEWICLPCSGVDARILKIATDQRGNLDYICKPCKEDLPKIREIMTIKQMQTQLTEDLAHEKETNRKFREEQIQVNEEYNRRLRDIETVIKEKKLADAQFPPLTQLTAQAKTLSEVVAVQRNLADSVKTQKAEQRKLDNRMKVQNNIIQEEKRKEDKEKNLVVYGIPEGMEDSVEQMKKDFDTVKELYSSRISLHQKDLINVTRLGTKKAEEPNKIRPIRITFSSAEKRLQILRNNKNLILYSEVFPECTAEFCDEDEEPNHKHIYVSPDKTVQQREQEKELREQLKMRKLTEPNLIIRNGKIIKKSTEPQARWADLVDGW